MSTQYIAYINEKECGPIDYDGLESFASFGELNDDTHVRFADSADWRTWKEIRSLKLEDDIRKGKIEKVQREAQSPAFAPRVLGDLEVARVWLRANTAYPVLRVCLIVILVVSAIGVVVCLCILSSQDSLDSQALAIAGIAMALSSIFWALILGALLDIADASLRKIE